MPVIRFVIFEIGKIQMFVFLRFPAIVALVESDLVNPSRKAAAVFQFRQRFISSDKGVL
jgi:hypothetical protein